MILLNGCSTKQIEPKIKTVTEIKYIHVAVPIDLLECDPLPKVPSVTKQSEVGVYVIKLFNVADSCNKNIKLFKEIVNEKN